MPYLQETGTDNAVYDTWRGRTCGERTCGERTWTARTWWARTWKAQSAFNKPLRTVP